MFTFDNTAIILSATLVILALLTSLLNPFLRKVRISEHGVPASVTDTEEAKDADDTAEEAVNTTEEVDVISETACTLPSISIIFTPHDNAGELTKYLPFYLNQN